MSSACSRRGGMVTEMTLRRWKRSARNFSSRTAFCKSLLLAARKRTFSLMDRVPPTRTNSRS